MAPRSVVLATDDYLHLDDDESVGHLEERNINIDFKKIINDLRTIDYSKVVWKNFVIFSLLHIYALYGFYLAFTSAMWTTIVFSYVLYIYSGLGITMGVHRLWAHRSYKATFPLRLFLAIGQTLALQNDIFEWARDHRGHHKYSETDADPHNAQRGFFFSHIGWLMYRKHPSVVEKGKSLNVDDLYADPIVRYQRKFYKPLAVLICFVLPTVIPWYFWGEHWLTALMLPGFFRYVFTLHCTWAVNSLAHWIGSKPYDKTIYPSQNKIVSSIALGEGWHNYHHVFPFDYRTSEMVGVLGTNLTTYLINLSAKIGLAYDLKIVDDKVIAMRRLRTGVGGRDKEL